MMALSDAPTQRSHPDGWDRTNPMDTERRLRSLLEGKRLVGELDLTRDGIVFEMAAWVFRGATSYGDYTRLSRYPAVTAVFLAGEGAHCYDEGTFWPNIELLGDASPGDCRIVGEMFERAVRGLGLEDFSGVGGLRYVTPILLHGGIPADCARDAAELVQSGLRKGVQDATELIDGILRSPGAQEKVQQTAATFFRSLR